MQIKKNRLKKKLDDTEAKIVSEALKRNKWRLASAARALGLPPSTLQSIIKRNAKLSQAYAKRGHGRGRPFGKRKPK